MQVLGAAAASYVLSRIMGRRGRRVGLVAGYLSVPRAPRICVVGGCRRAPTRCCCWVRLLLGSNSATNYQARYAAADLASPLRRARALSMVLWATTFGAVLGPNLVGPGRRPRRGGWRLPAADRTVPGLGRRRARAPAVVVGLPLRPDPLLVAARGRPARRRAGEVRGGRRLRGGAGPRAGAASTPASRAASSPCPPRTRSMVAVMIMTPLHMHGRRRRARGDRLRDQHPRPRHVLLLAVDRDAGRPGRAGRRRCSSARSCSGRRCGSAGSAPMGASVQIGVGLFLLGLGWSFCTVAGSALLTDSTPLDGQDRRPGCRGHAHERRGRDCRAARRRSWSTSSASARSTSSPRCSCSGVLGRRWWRPGASRSPGSAEPARSPRTAARIAR